MEPPVLDLAEWLELADWLFQLRTKAARRSWRMAPDKRARLERRIALLGKLVPYLERPEWAERRTRVV